MLGTLRSRLILIATVALAWKGDMFASRVSKFRGMDFLLLAKQR